MYLLIICYHFDNFQILFSNILSNRIVLTCFCVRYDSLSLKFRKQRQVLETTESGLKEATKANERLSILSASLNKQLNAANTTLTSRERQLQDVAKRMRELEERASDATSRLSRERLEKQSAKIDLEQMTSQLNQHKMAFEEAVKARYTSRVTQLETRIVELEKQLEEERASHARDLRGLQHLRAHFASLPYTDTTNSNMVVEDELKTWST